MRMPKRVLKNELGRRSQLAGDWRKRKMARLFYFQKRTPRSGKIRRAYYTGVQLKETQPIDRKFTVHSTLLRMPNILFVLYYSNDKNGHPETIFSPVK